MASGEQRRSLTSEIADQTLKKNEFERRRLQRKVQELDELAAKQQKKRKDEQLEYALGNLSLEDMDTFNDLTRKILRSNFLPPIKRKARGGTSGADAQGNGNDLQADRLRRSKLIHRYLEGKGPRKLTRTLSVDSGMISLSGKQHHATRTEQRQNKPGPYSAFVKIHPHRRPLSYAKTRTQLTRKLDDDPIVGTFSAKNKTTARRVKSDNSISSSKSKTSNEAVRGFVRDERNIQHHSMSEAIEYKLKMRELSRKS